MSSGRKSRKARSIEPASDAPHASSPDASFPIVGIGASAKLVHLSQAEILKPYRSQRSG